MSQDNAREMHFHVGYSGKLAELRRLLSFGELLKTVYTGGVVGKIANTQRYYLPEFEQLSQQVNLCHQAGVQIELLLDATCFSARHLWVRGQPLLTEYIGQIEEAGVDGVIVSDPVVVELVKTYSDLHVTISRASCVNSVSRVNFYQQLGADAIVLDPILNRKFERLELVVEALGQVQPRLLLNEGCILQCPFEPYHYNLSAHPETPVSNDYYLLNCTAMRLEDPSLILRSPTIRPEDLSNYKQLINQACLAPRSPRRKITQNQVLQAYAQGYYEGNLLDLFSNRGEPIIRNIFIQNRSLNGVWGEKWQNCMATGSCDGCNYCQDLVEIAMSETVSNKGQFIKKIGEAE